MRAVCGRITIALRSLEGCTDSLSKAGRSELKQAADAHRRFHTTERKHYDDAVFRASKHPSEITTITIDAPTRHQFDLPAQGAVPTTLQRVGTLKARASPRIDSAATVTG